MKQEEKFTLISDWDSLELKGFFQEAEKEDERKGIVVIVHGMSEHKERYLPFMQFLAGAGYASIIIDHRGHGESIREEGDLGYLYKKGEIGLVEDTHLVVKEAKKRCPETKVFMFCHSMGSLIGRIYLQEHDDELSGIVISGCVANNPAAPMGKCLAKVIGKIKGDHHRSVLLALLAFGSYNKGLENADSPNAWLNSDPELVHMYDDDPLSGYLFTCNGNVALMNLIKNCYKKPAYMMKNPDLEILFISGQQDPCCAGEKGFSRTVTFLEQLGYKNVNGLMLPGMRHEILNEREHQKVYDLVEAHFGKVNE